MKLELKHLAPYLPYGLKIKAYDNIWNLDGYRVSAIKPLVVVNQHSLTSSHLREVKPLLRPISSMTKEEAYEFGILLMGEADMEDKEVGIGEMRLMGATYPTIVYKDKEDEEYSITIQFSSVGISGIDLVPYEAYEWLFDHHFDVFNLIENNLAIAK